MSDAKIPARFKVLIESHGRYQWTGKTLETRMGGGACLCTMRCRTPQEVLRELADQIDRAVVNEFFVPFGFTE